MQAPAAAAARVGCVSPRRQPAVRECGAWHGAGLQIPHVAVVQHRRERYFRESPGVRCPGGARLTRTPPDDILEVGSGWPYVSC